MKKSKWLSLLFALIVGCAILLAPTPSGLTPVAQQVLAVAVFTILLWMFQVMNNGIAAILMMGLMVLVGVKPGVALGGFAGSSFWILVCVLYYGCAMQKTGLAQRLSYYVLSLFPGTYGGINFAFFLIGLVLAMGIPSMTVRTAIMVPIAWALVQSLELKPRSRGSALIMITTVEMAVIPGTVVLYGSLFGPFVDSVFKAKGFPLIWLEFSQVMAVPTLILCGLILLLNPIIMKPEEKLRTTSSFVKDKLKALGAVTRAEWITSAVVILSIAFWATDRVHNLPSFLVGMFGMAVLALAGVLKDEDIGGGVSWTMLLFIGGIFGLSTMIQEYKITDWLTGYFLPVAENLASSTLLILLVMAVTFLLLRFFDPTGFIALPVLFLPVADVIDVRTVPPLILISPMILAAAPFWLSHQNFWIAMGEGMTGNQAFSPGQRVKLATLYAGIVLVTLAISVGYWKLIGML
ncbi:MAG: anion permease [Acidobacteriota bacterium]|jgi:DASS family divalent anion:Na+ symporter|nr:anion permease [Acidobacteriota bacterium]